MAYSQKRAAATAAIVSILLFAVAGVVAGDPPSSSSSSASATKNDKTPAAHARKLLINTNTAAAAAVAAVKKRRRSTAPSECSQDAVVVSQAEAGGRSGGVPCYSVTITNTCLSCTVRDLHVACGEFGSARLVDPSDFRRLAVGDCLVRGGGAVGPGETVSFDYSNQFPYDLHVASVACACG